MSKNKTAGEIDSQLDSLLVWPPGEFRYWNPCNFFCNMSEQANYMNNKGSKTDIFMGCFLMEANLQNS